MTKKKIFEALTVLLMSIVLVAGAGQTRTSENDISEPIVETVANVEPIGAGFSTALYEYNYVDVESTDIPRVEEALEEKIEVRGNVAQNDQTDESQKESCEDEDQSTERSDKSNQAEETTASDSSNDELGKSVRESGIEADESNSATSEDSQIPSGAFRVSSTAYYNPNGNRTADGSRTIAGLTLAGKREWLGRSCRLYQLDGTCLGSYEFHDTGWGIDGDILRGETVDIYFETYDECIQYGRRDIYVEFID